jgi:basic amino acid/polyamine antiporter, APA family
VTCNSDSSKKVFAARTEINVTPHAETKAAGSTRLARKLNTFDAIVIGLGSMIGAGVFAVIGPTAQAAGTGLLASLVIAALVAYCNALSSAQLAALYPESGGAYIYGRKRLGAFWGFLAGWGFVVGKLASCAAMALTFASYAAPQWMRPLAVAAVLLMTAVNYFGIQKTAIATRAIMIVVLTSLAIVVFATLYGSEVETERLLPLTSTGPYGVLQAAGLWFFAFAGYARLATLGEEVIDPARTIPRAIPIALGITLLVYAAVAIAALLAVDVDTLARATAPLATAVEAGGLPGWAPVVRIGATVASLGVLLSLVVGVSRTVFSMAANHDLPRFFAAVHPRYRVPHRAELGVGILVAVTVAFVDLRSAIGFSAFTVLTYYAVANAAALTLKRSERRWPRWIAVAGLAGCSILAFTLPVASVVVGSTVLVTGIVIFVLRAKLAPAVRGGPD